MTTEHEDTLIAVDIDDYTYYVTLRHGERLLGMDPTAAERFTPDSAAAFIDMNGGSYVQFMGATSVKAVQS